MDTAIRKAEVLIEALSYIRTFQRKLTVVKLGGSAMEDALSLRETLQDIAFLSAVGIHPILVHGGGKPIDRAMAEAGLKPRKVQGRRYTDDATLEIVVRVLLQEINRDIETTLRHLGARAVGPHRGALHFLFGEQLYLTGSAGDKIDLGRVGKVGRIDVALLKDLCRAGIIPVIPSLAVDADGNWLNVNADTAASAVAAQLQAEKLMLLTDTPGILLDRSDEGSLLRSLDAAQCRELIQRGVIDEGMIPKVEACLDSLQAGVKKTHIIDGRVKHSLLLEIFTDRGVGTEIVFNA